MYKCPYFKDCSRDFFDGYLRSAQAVIFVIEHEYCQYHYEKCARYAAAQQLSNRKVPNELYPSQMKDALELIMLESAYRRESEKAEKQTA